MEPYIKISIALNDDSFSDILIAQLISCKFEGFEEEAGLLNAFISQTEFSISGLENIVAHHGVAYTKTVIGPKNWNEEWEKNFEPVIVENFCGIRAYFHPPFRDLEHEIVITPKMSFGTGHHATTYLMIKAIRAIDCKGKKVLDFGTGTGVLAILAEKCGAKKIIAIDIDDWSMENAGENIKENSCLNITLQKDDSIKQTPCFDIILANINKNVILQQFATFKQHLEHDGVLLLSGLLSTDYAEIENEAINNDFHFLSTLEKENWICIVLKQVKTQALS